MTDVYMLILETSSELNPISYLGTRHVAMLILETDHKYFGDQLQVAKKSNLLETKFTEILNCISMGTHQILTIIFP